MFENDISVPSHTTRRASYPPPRLVTPAPADPRTALVDRLDPDVLQTGRPFFAVIPGTKRPAVASWTDPAQCHAMPPSGWYGMTCGPRSGAWVLDLDVRLDKNGVEAIEAWCRENDVEQPRTFTIRTPSGGRHLLFNWPEQGVRQRTGFLPGCDTRTDGGYIIAAGSPGYRDPHRRADSRRTRMALGAGARRGPTPERSAFGSSHRFAR